MRATSRHTGALVLWVAACAWLAACAAEQPEPPPFGDDSATEDEVSVGPSTANAAGPTTNATSAAGNTTSGTSGNATSGNTSGGTSGGNTSGGTTGGQTTANPLGGTQTSTVTVGGASTTGSGVTNGGATTGGGFTNGGAATTGSVVTNGGAATTGAGPTTGGGFTNGGAASSTTGGGTCTNVRPTGTDWDEATCDQWASETTECDMAWMVDNDYCNESCGRCGAAAPFGGN